MKWILGIFAVVLPALCETPIAAASDENKTLSPYFWVDGATPGVESFPLESTKVSASVSGVIADVVVKQVYRNTGTSPLHARYVFPASTRAAVHGMTIRLGDKVIVARIKEREAANKEFQAAKQAGKTASLLDQERPNIFTMSVANVLPGDRVEVELRYTELLLPTEGVYQFVYPTVVGPRYTNQAASTKIDWVKSPYLRAGRDTPSTFDIDVSVSAGMPVADIHSSSHAVNVVWERPSLARISLAKVDGTGNRDFILDYRLAGREIQSGLLLHEGPRENFFLLMVQPPAAVTAAAIPPREYIFVLDVSGSMHGFPLDTAKSVIRDLIGHLRPTDRFNVILFSGAARLMAPSSLAANRENVEHAIAVIDQETGGGGTELEGALRMALGLPRAEHVSRTVVVVTDGYIAEEPGAFALIHENLQGTNVFAFGIGSSVNRHLIEGVARAGQGEPFVVTNPAEAAATGARFRRYIESPVLTDIRVTARDFETFDVEPSVQADLFAERPIIVFGKWRGPRRGDFVVTGRTANGTFSSVIQVAGVAPGAENGALPQLWARTRIARLSEFNFRDDGEAIREVTNLGLTYSLLTKHTSFIAVLEEVRNHAGTAHHVDQPSPLPQGVSELALGEEYQSGAEPELWLLMILAATGVTVMSFRKRKLALAV